jgi:hypothetical protein
MRDRHCREQHGEQKAKILKTRHVLAAARQKTNRLNAALLARSGGERNDDCSGVLFLILCPQRRELTHEMFSDTKRHLMEQGVQHLQIRRVEGLDLKVPKIQGDATEPVLAKSQVVMHNFHRHFLPYAERAFAQDDQLELFFFFARTICGWSRARPWLK